MQTTINTVAGIWSRLQVAGRLVSILDTGAVTSCELQIEIPGQNVEQFDAVGRGFKARMISGHFGALMVRTASDAAIEVIISDNDLDFNFAEGAAVQATISGPLPLPVSNDRGDSPGNVVYTSNVAAADQPAVAAPDNAAVACTAAQALILAADADRRQIVFTNIGTDPVALGATGITWAKRCIILNSGDSWVEDRAANLAWYGICDATKTASVTTKSVTV